MQENNYSRFIHGFLKNPGKITNRTASSKIKVYYDATLILRHGLNSAVGIIRVEHYIAIHLTKYTELDLEFITFCSKSNEYRRITHDEHNFIIRILFRKELSEKKTCLKNEPIELTLRDGPTNIFRWGSIKKTNGVDFKLALHGLLLHYFTIKKGQSVLKRLIIRISRYSIRKLAFLYYLVIKKNQSLCLKFKIFLNKLIEPDFPSIEDPNPLVCESKTSIYANIRHFKKAYSQQISFNTSEVLLCFGNGWDYLNYSYLSNLVNERKIRLISIIYDVIGADLPFVTPAPAHHYHRHWVEIGHISERLVAISRFSADSYIHFIGKPNNIDVPLHYSLLPNFLHHDALEIGEVEVNGLYAKNFILYCSTIEIRKNHILLLNLWEEMRQRILPERLPLLIFAGKWGWSTDLIRLLIERNWKIRPYIRVLDEVTDAQLIWLYRNAQFTVFPSLSEGFGLAAAESLAFGTPVIISNCPALQEATEYLMPSYHPHDFIGWRDELERLILKPDYLDSLRKITATFKGPAYADFSSLVHEAICAPSSLNPQVFKCREVT